MSKKNKPQKKIIERELYVDEIILFDDIDKVIKFLQDIKNKHPDKKLYIDDHWTGYEDVEYRFLYQDEETDEEFQDRLEMEEYHRQQAIKEKERLAQRKKDIQDYNRLKSKLGF